MSRIAPSDQLSVTFGALADPTRRAILARLTAGAVMLMFFSYAFVNMAMVSGLLPIVGVPLPLISFGGSALVSLFIGLGILMSVQANRKLIKT